MKLFCFGNIKEMHGIRISLYWPKSEGTPMYTSEDLWPIKCPKCFHEFTETIGQMMANEDSRCPSCSLKLTRSREQFAIVLTQARAGGVQSLARYDET